MNEKQVSHEERRANCKMPGMGRSRRAEIRTAAYREGQKYENAHSARTAHPIPNVLKWPRPTPIVCTQCNRRSRDCTCAVPYNQRVGVIGKADDKKEA